MEEVNVSVIGAGAWGTTIANIISDKGNDVMLWVHSEKTLSTIIAEKENKNYLPGIKLNDNIKFNSSLEEAVRNKDLLFISTPSRYLTELILRLREYISEGTRIVSLVKGMTISEPQEPILDYIFRLIDKIPKENYFVLSGPNFAFEIAKKLPAATVIAGSDEKYLSFLQSFLSTEYFRVYTNTDYVGVQLGGALKNIIAIAAGICDGFGLGSNTKSSLIVRGINEMKSIFIQMGGRIDTLYGLSGLGDLIGTCTSDLSRNRWAGIQIAQGIDVRKINESGEKTIEGISTLPAIINIADKLGLELPICRDKHQTHRSINEQCLNTSDFSSCWNIQISPIPNND